jgi:site-specific recombinase XerD
MKLSTCIIDYLESLVVEKNRSQRTIEAYQHYLRRFQDWFKGDPEIETISNAQIRKYRLYLHNFLDDHNDPLDVKTQTYHIIALRGLLRWCIKNDIECLSPDKIELPKLEPAQVQFLTTEELEKLLNTPNTSTMSGLRDRALLELLFSTGMRVSELAALDRESISTASGELRIIGKGRKERIVFISERAKEWYTAYLNRRHDEEKAAFVGYRGKGVGTTPSIKVEMSATRLTPRSIDRIVAKHALQAGLVKHITPHTMRHSFATDLLLNGADIRSVQTLLGHASIATTQVYTHITDQHLKDVFDKHHGIQLEADEPA